jgi:DNA-binding response OmpR family regulator
MRILVVEDDPKIASFLTDGFSQAGFAVDRFESGEDGLRSAREQEYDAAIVDLMLPGLDGLSMIQEMRAEKVRTPVIVLSAKREVDDRVECLQHGADDYVGKPFAFSELLARTHAVMRRARGTAEPTVLEVADLVLDRLSREVRRNGVKIDLQPREFALLEQLMRSPGKALSKTFLLERLWDYSFDPQTNVVDVLVCRLRNKVDKDFERKLIHTIRGVGYVLRAD